MKKYVAISMLFAVFIFCSTKIYALGDGPRAYWAVPEGTNVLTPMWISIDSNHSFDNSLVVPDAEFDTDILVLMYTRAVSFAGHLGGISLIVPGGRVDGGLPNTGFRGNSSGLGDISALATMSLFGAPAYTPEEFASYKPETILDLLLAVTAPTGEYDSDDVINMGSNRWSIRVGMPFMHFFRSGAGQSTSLELQPAVTFFTDNNDASGASSKLEQDVIYTLEGHFTHDFNLMFWGSLDALYTTGGETTVDGIDKDNAQRSLGAGVTLGVYFSKTTGITASYGTVVEHNDSSQDGEMFRITLKYLF